MNEDVCPICKQPYEPWGPHTCAPPAADRPTVDELVPLIRSYYAKPGNGVGGSLHIVFEDGNIADGHIAHCLDYARERGDHDGVVIAMSLMQMTPTQRRNLAARDVSVSTTEPV